MKLNQSAVLEFQSIYQQEFGEEISLTEAENEAQNLLTLFTVIAKK